MELDTMGWISLIPAIIAIVLSFATKNTIIALITACLTGTLLAGQGIMGLPTLIKEATGTTGFSWVMLLNLYIAVIVAFFHKMGSIQAFSDWVHSKNLSRKGTQLLAWVGGISDGTGGRHRRHPDTGAGADHIDHVKTQLPYSLVCGSLAVILYLILGFTSL